MKLYPYLRLKFERKSRRGGLWLLFNLFLEWVETKYWKLRGYTIVECYGDSHVKVFRHLNSMSPGCFRFRTLSVQGATAYSLNNDRSATQASKKFANRIKKLPSDGVVLFLIGEVDLGYLIWAKAESSGRDRFDVMAESVNSYVTFVNKVLMTNKSVVIVSAPLPTLSDSSVIPNYVSIRGSISCSQKERTEMTLLFNKKLKRYCDDCGVHYLDLDGASLDPATGLVNPMLVNSSGLDHHYIEDYYAKIINSKWNELVSYKFDESRVH
jgi:hypothetical protein